MAYLVIAYPELGPKHLELIQQYREQYDELFDVVLPHFTFVFPVTEFTESEFIQEVEKQSELTRKFDFTLRCATISKDIFHGHFNIFLVPDEGNSNMIRLHDKLYSGLFKEHLRLDIDYIPHIRIGNSPDKLQCKKLVDEWNERNISIGGTISQLTVIKFDNNIVSTVKTKNLK